MDIPLGRLVHQKGSGEQALQVYQTDTLRLLRSDRQTVQSALHLKCSERLVLPHQEAMLTGLLFCPTPKNILLLGLGGGDLVRYLHHRLPDCHIETVEKDPRMLEIAREYFNYPKSSNIQNSIADAGDYLTDSPTNRDWLMIDLFGQQGMPECLNQASFYRHCHRAIGPNGVMILNFISSDAGQLRHILQILRQQFQGYTLCLSIPDHHNIVILAFRRKPEQADRDTLLLRAQQLSPRFGLNFEELITRLFATNPTVDDELCLGIQTDVRQ